MNRPQAPKFPELAALLERHLAEIARNSAEISQRLPDSHYLERPVAELQASAEAGLGGVISALTTGSYAVLDNYLSDVSLTRLSQGFDIGEVIESILLWKEAAFPFIWSEFPPHSEETHKALSLMDACLRYAMGWFGREYAGRMRRHLEEQQRRTTLILRAVQMASGSLEVDQVLERVAQGMVTALGVRHCGVYMLDAERNILVPRIGSGKLTGLQLYVFRQRVLDPSQDDLLREVLERRAPAACYDAESDPRISTATVRAFGIKSVLAVPIEVGDRLLGIALVSTFDDNRVFAHDEIELAWGIANAAALAIENARLFEETKRRLSESQSLQKVTVALLEKLSLAEVLEIVCTEAQRLTGASGSAVFLLEDEEWLKVALSTGSAAPAFDRLPIDGSQTGMVVRSGKPLLTRDQATDALGYQWSAEPTDMLAVPLRVKGKVIGAIDVLNHPGGFSDDNVRIISLFADEAAIAIESARLHQQEERLAVVEERQRLARDLHDSVTQSLYSVTLYAEATARLLGAGDLEVATHYLGELRDTAQEALRETRLLIFELRPSVLEKEGLTVALEARLEAVEARGGLKTEMRVDGDEPLPFALEEELYRIAQEALNNIIKHAKAHNVSVHLEQTRQSEKLVRVRLSVQDDGDGFDPAAGRDKGGLGLRGMEERIQRFGGTLSIESAPGAGTKVQAEVVVEADQGPSRPSELKPPAISG
jgi:signal transduction histidine kinase